MRHGCHFFSIKFFCYPVFCFILQDEEVVCLSQYLISICTLSFRWVKEIDLCKSAFEIIEVSEDVITIAKEDEYARKVHVEETYLSSMAHKVVAAPPRSTFIYYLFHTSYLLFVHAKVGIYIKNTMTSIID